MLNFQPFTVARANLNEQQTSHDPSAIDTVLIVDAVIKERSLSLNYFQG